MDTSAGSQNWLGTCLSADGQTAVAIASPGYLYHVVLSAAATSTSSSAPTRAPTRSPTETPPSQPTVVATSDTSLGVQLWSSVAGSSNGTFLVAAVNGGSLYTSSDSGVTWTPVSGAGSPGSQKFTSVASSAAGNGMVAVTVDGKVYTSTDYGKTWTAQPAAPPLNWTSLASSLSGQQLTVTAANGDMYTSTDGGRTWAPVSLPSSVANTTLVGVAVSSSGTVQITAAKVRRPGGLACNII